jgi:UDP-GlcNAc:undecaprenyl-phosphate GlcNAc-1-phosphate transferase
MVLGLVDDVRPLPWQLRLGVQMVAAIAGIWIFGGIQPEDSSSIAHYLLWPAAVIWIVGLTNAFNMLDNMDALSGGVAWIAAALFVAASILATFCSTLTIQYSAFTIDLMLMGGLTGFLWFNRPPARIFMGDAGSTFIGFFFGTMSLLFAGMSDLSVWTLALCFLAIPWYDLVSVVSIRLRQGRSPFHADKQHLSHRLVALGLSPPRAVGTICLLAAVIGAGGLLFGTVPNHGTLLIWIWMVGCWVALAVFEFMTRGKRQTADKSS